MKGSGYYSGGSSGSSRQQSTSPASTTPVQSEGNFSNKNGNVEQWTYTRQPGQQFIAGTNVPDTPITQRIAAGGFFSGGKPVAQTTSGGTTMAYPVFGTGGSRKPSPSLFDQTDAYVKNYEPGNGPGSLAIKAASLYYPQFINPQSSFIKGVGQSGDRFFISGPKAVESTGVLVNTFVTPITNKFNASSVITVGRAFEQSNNPIAKLSGYGTAATGLILDSPRRMISGFGAKAENQPFTTGSEIAVSYGAGAVIGFGVGALTEGASMASYASALRAGLSESKAFSMGLRSGAATSVGLGAVGGAALVAGEANKNPEQIGGGLPTIVAGGYGFSQGFRAINRPLNVKFSLTKGVEGKQGAPFNDYTVPSDGRSLGKSGAFFELTGERPVEITISAFGKTQKDYQLQGLSIRNAPTTKAQFSRGQVMSTVDTVLPYNVGEKQLLARENFDAVLQFPSNKNPGTFVGINPSRAFEITISPTANVIEGYGLSTKAVSYRTSTFSLRSKYPVIESLNEGIYRQDTFTYNPKKMLVGERQYPGSIEITRNGIVQRYPSPMKKTISNPFDVTAVRARTLTQNEILPSYRVQLLDPEAANRGFSILKQNDLFTDKNRNVLSDFVRSRRSSYRPIRPSSRVYALTFPAPVSESVSVPISRVSRSSEVFNRDVFPNVRALPSPITIGQGSILRVVPNLRFSNPSSERELVNTPSFNIARSQNRIGELPTSITVPRITQDQITRQSFSVSTAQNTNQLTEQVNVVPPSGPSPLPPQVLPPMLPPPVFPGLPTFGRGGGSGSASRRGRLMFKYVPDVTSGLYKIRGPQPRGPFVSPASLRPLPLLSKKKKRGSR